MKKIILISTLILFIQTLTISQTCLPEGITFTTQLEIDDFPLNYPDCTEIEGNVLIISTEGEVEVTNLDSLSALIAINGNLRIGNSSFGNWLLTSLNGLSNLTTIGGQLRIINNPELENLTGLENLTSIGSVAGAPLDILNNASLTSLIGLEN